MENNIESMELEEMRQQMAALKAQLDEQLQLNENRLQRILEQERRDILGFGSWYLVGAILTAIISPFVFYYVTDGTYSICIAISISCLLEGAFHYYISHHINKSNLSCTSMKETAVNLIKANKQITKFTIIDNFILVPIICIWMGYIIWKHFQIPFYTIILDMFIGYVIGISIELYVISRQKRNIYKMIDTLQEGMEL